MFSSAQLMYAVSKRAWTLALSGAYHFQLLLLLLLLVHRTDLLMDEKFGDWRWFPAHRLIIGLSPRITSCSFSPITMASLLSVWNDNLHLAGVMTLRRLSTHTIVARNQLQIMWQTPISQAIS